MTKKKFKKEMHSLRAVFQWRNDTVLISLDYFSRKEQVKSALFR